MRITVDVDERRWQAQFDRYNKPENEGGPTGTQIRKFDRSDITKVKMINGWRNPTAYESHDVTTRDPFVDSRKLFRVGGPRLYSGPAYIDGNNPLMGPYRHPDAAIHGSLYYSALKKAKDAALNIAVLLAELGESIHLVASRAKLFGRLFDLARAKRWEELLQMLGIDKNYNWKCGRNDVLSRWLELWFGWAPILSDIYGIVDAVGRKQKETGYTIVSRARRPSEDQVLRFDLLLPLRQKFGWYKNSWLNNASFGGASQPIGNCTVRKKEGYSVNLWFKVNNPTLQTASALGLTNPASVYWELTTLSWFADFFVDIGNWIESLDTIGLEFLGGTKVWWYEWDSTIDNIYYRPGVDQNGTTVSLSGNDGRYSRKQSKRTVVTGTEIPFYIKDPFDIWKAVTTVALVSGKFR